MSESRMERLMTDPVRKPIEMGGIRVLGYKNRTELRSKIKELKTKAEVDTLTNLKRLAELPVFLDKKLSQDTPATMLFIDIDIFKEVNDLHGHPFGNSFLEVVGKRLSHMFPQHNDTFVCRFGGDEFVVVMTGNKSLSSVDIGLTRAEEFRQEMEKNPVSIGGKSVTKTVSIGVAVRTLGESSQNWINRADQAMYAAKDMGRNRIIVSAI